MTLKKNSIAMSVFCLAIGLVAFGCNQNQTTNQTPTESETSLVATSTGDCCSGENEGGCPACAEAAALASTKTEDCGDCPVCAGDETAKCKCEESTTVAAKLAETTTPAKGCCGKCAEEQQLVNKKTAGCGDCTACSSGDSANCKCMDDSASIKANSADAKSTEIGSEKSANATPASDFAHDRDVFHFLLSNKDKIKREVKETSKGVETLTESSDPAIVEKIQEHVASMYQRVENVQPIRMRDPLYREIFKHTDKIEMKLENTDNGIRVTESSDDEYVVKLIQSHAKVVSGFVEHGFEEAHKNHEPPKQ